MDLFPDLQCQRVFLGWDAPLLPRAVDFFSDRFAQERQLDLQSWICALPTTQSAIRFEELLEQGSSDRGLQLEKPWIVTAGDLAEALYSPERPIAIEFEQTLAWAQVLRDQERSSLRPLLPVLPETDSLTTWMELAGTLRRLSVDLAAHNVEFSQVVSYAESDEERQRWNLLDRLMSAYLDRLQQSGLSDPHEQRRRAVTRNRIRKNRRLALIGTSDLNESVSRVVAKVEQDVYALIAAPPEMEHAFDWVGRLDSMVFADHPLPIQDHHLLSAQDVNDQTLAAVEVANDFLADHSIDQIAIGVTDDSQIAPAEMQFEGTGIEPYRHAGWPVASLAIGRMIDMISTLVARPTWRSLSALVRHADVHRYLTHHLQSDDADFLIQLDQLMANHLPRSLSDPLPKVARQRYPQAIALRQQVGKWLVPLCSCAGNDSETTNQDPLLLDTFSATKTISDWCIEILTVLDAVYSDLPPESPTGVDRRLSIAATDKIRELLLRLSKLDQHLDLKITASTALETLSARLTQLRVGYERNDQMAQIHGWLDLPLDDSPAMVVIGLNHPFVPSSVTSDPYLPGSLRSKLRIQDNERRYARDAYATQLILSTRKSVRFIVGKTAADGSPTPPSRLLSAAPSEDVARRIRSLLSQGRDSVVTKHLWDNGIERTELPIPTARVFECPVKTMSVTAFKSYLECPFRFYLRHVLKLKPVDESATELAANQFGDLVHGAVEYFGLSDAKDEPDEQRIFEALRDQLHRYADENYGERVESAVTMQIRQAERRLRFVATEQAKRIAAGWRIHAIEASVSESTGAEIIVDEKPMGLRGRFDRIDQHQSDGRWAILDYKTHGHKPEKKHLRNNRETGKQEWIDLQLPLYQMMIPFLGIEAPVESVELGYFNVADKEEETRVNVARFSEEQMKEANELIEQCIRRIFACDFRPSDDRIQYDDYEMIMQTGIATRMISSESEAMGGTQ